MSSLASLFNSSASLFTVDIYEKLRPAVREAPAARRAHRHRGGGQPGYSLDSGDGEGAGRRPLPVPPERPGLRGATDRRGLPAGLFWKRVNAAGAVWGLGAGFVIGMIKLTIQTFLRRRRGPDSRTGPARRDWRLQRVLRHRCAGLISAAIIIVASLVTPPPAEENIRGLTYGSIHREAAGEIKASWDFGNKLMVFLILACVIGCTSTSRSG